MVLKDCVHACLCSNAVRSIVRDVKDFVRKSGDSWVKHRKKPFSMKIVDRDYIAQTDGKSTANPLICALSSVHCAWTSCE